MARMKGWLLAIVLVTAPGFAQAGALLELYTSQGCYSCPPADQFLGEFIAENPQHVALEFHVDYWDDLVYGSAGVWKDPFSSPKHSARQRRYNQVDLQGQDGVYTPQMVVNGQFTTVGSSRAKVKQYVERSSSPLAVQVSVEDGQYIALVSGDHTSDATIWVARFERMRDTNVIAGENLGKTMRNHHMVRSLHAADRWRGETKRVAIGKVNEDSAFGCAVFVQSRDLGPVLGASYCP